MGEALLKVFERFDGMLIDGASLRDLTAAAAEMLEAEVRALDVLNDVAVTSGTQSPDPNVAAIGHELLRLVAGGQNVQREVARYELDACSFAVAPLEHARGRLGVVWSPKPARAWTDTDDLVFERYAQAASTAIQQHRRKSLGRADPSDSAIETLLAGPLDDPSATLQAVRAARLTEHADYLVLAMMINPPSIVSDAVATAAVGRALGRDGAWWRAATVLNAPLVVVSADTQHDRALNATVSEAAKSGWRLAIGVGGAVRPDRLHESAAQAREALVLGGSSPEGGVTSFSGLGALHLLAEIPSESLRANPDIAAVVTLARSRSGDSDLALLIAYCETGSLRKTGERMYLHHSSVEYRLRRIEATLGFSVTTPTGRFRALVATTIARMSDDALQRG